MQLYVAMYSYFMDVPQLCNSLGTALKDDGGGKANSKAQQ